ncbi:MAG: cytochrome P450 [Microbacteriaceae bacterium]
MTTVSSPSGNGQKPAPSAPPGWDARSPELLADQIHAYDMLRARCPVAYDDHFGWTVFTHDDTVRILGDHRMFSSVVSAHHPAVPNGFDPPVHTAYRRIIDRYFTIERTAEFEPDCRSVAAELVDTLPRDVEVEFIERFALTFALRAQRRWLGWPHAVEQTLREWTSRNHRATLARDRDALAAIANAFDSTIRSVLDARRAPYSVRVDDLTQELLDERFEGRPLSDDELVSILRNWTVGELGTISASVGIIVRYLAEHLDLQESLRENPDEIPRAVDEILRIHPPLIASRRVTTGEIELGGYHIPAGERVTVLWASANRDEAVFGDPDHFDPVHSAHNLLYGRGIHHCPGESLARMELRVVMEELLAATSRIELVELRPDNASFPAGGFRSLRIKVAG